MYLAYVEIINNLKLKMNDFLNRCGNCSTRKYEIKQLLNYLPMETVECINKFHCCSICEEIKCILDSEKNVLTQYLNEVEQRTLLLSYYLNKLSKLIHPDQIFMWGQLTKYNIHGGFFDCLIIHYRDYEPCERFYRFKMKLIDDKSKEKVGIKELLMKYYNQTEGQFNKRTKYIFSKSSKEYFNKPMFSYLKIEEINKKYYCNKKALDETDFNFIAVVEAHNGNGYFSNILDA